MIEETPRNKILTGNVLTVLKSLKKETIDCIVTSPPYYGLRSYGTEPQIWGGKEDCQHEFTKETKKGITGGPCVLDGAGKNMTEARYIPDTKYGFCIHCNAWKGELGLEPTFQLYLEHLWMIFDEIKRVLKKTGTCWVNLGDSYGGSGNASGHTENTKNLGYTTANMGATKGHTKNYQAKSLLQIPSRFSIGMTDRGWILRNSIIWYKRNCMPSSARDRFTVDYEMMYFFTKSTKYYFEQQFEKSVDKESYTGRRKRNVGQIAKFDLKNYQMAGSIREDGTLANEGKTYPNRNKRCVWDITPKGFKEAHFAVFPPELVETPIKAGCPESGIVLDPFFGSGTTGSVAIKLGRNFLGIELKPEYVEIAERRLNKVGLFLNS